jgi:hypothetical protein
MTPDMAFECLLVSRDPEILSGMGRLLRDFSICTNLCLSSSRATGMLDEGNPDLIVIDWEGEASSELLEEIWKSPKRRKPTIVAISTPGNAIRGAHVILQKPVTAESAAKSLKTAYSGMLMDHRRNARHPLMLPLRATDENNRSIEVVVTDIGDGGIGLSVEQKLTIGEILVLRLSLPGARKEIYVQARVVWTRKGGAAGCEFVRIPPVDLSILHDWLRAKFRVKKPLIQM